MSSLDAFVLKTVFAILLTFLFVLILEYKIIDQLIIANSNVMAIMFGTLFDKKRHMVIIEDNSAMMYVICNVGTLKLFIFLTLLTYPITILVIIFLAFILYTRCS
ncbi:hypothetical protein, partial [Salmonella enterica]|uniref:hypothetical protein n=1 Tax=Salmonella enterica TaxID=28901 RepID=UPI0021B3EAB6